ncbi:MAG: hypothetical protein QOI01_1206 [Mycobacterium sp.]|jgi:hypothetical protein|nr:hypothetical protein [Mycobacterium sp.]
MHDDTKENPHVLEVRNADLIESLTQQAAEQGITYAAIVALIGAIDGKPHIHRRDGRPRRPDHRRAP